MKDIEYIIYTKKNCGKCKFTENSMKLPISSQSCLGENPVVLTIRGIDLNMSKPIYTFFFPIFIMFFSAI